MKKNGQQGTTLVEFALVIPLLALILFAIIQYGFIFSAVSTLRHAAQVTSRTMSLGGASTNNASTVANAAIQPLLDPAKLQNVGVSYTTVSGTPAVRVQLTYNLPLIIKFVVPGATGNTLTLTAEAIDRRF